ncbi:MAG: peptidase M14 [Gammaproteobacteria bacterium]|nr:peptidase M14 [Gammaproteobacteria bacterium]
MRLLALILGAVMTSIVVAKPSVEYLPVDADMDFSLTPPEAQLGWEPGDWRIQHPALVQYMYTLAEQSDRVSIKVTGHTYEQKPLLQVIITSPENQANLESLRQAHLEGANSGSSDAPLVVWLGYSVHGDEASGSNAAPIVAWYLAASQSDYVEALLDDTIVIIDPSLNPDGLDRFASWANSNASKNPVGDLNARIHWQDWPSGRTNHYLFDLNRDWLPLVHPESRARISEFHRWLPHVITDHHETGDDGFFFQPGVPTRQHPLTTAENLEMTRKLVPYHSASFDSAGEMYFTEDTYDDFYYGKGSTYPDINGSIGILYEQPRVNGAIMNRKSGQLTFTEAIHNHVRMSLSTLMGAYENRDEFKRYQAGFFRQMRQRAGKADFEAWVIGDGNDRVRALKLMDVFRRHQVEYLELADEIKIDGTTYKPGHAWVIPVNQRQFGLAQAMLETRTKFEDNTFYDVSAWNMAMAYNLPFAKLSRMPDTSNSGMTGQGIAPSADAVAWVISWQQLEAPALLQKLLDAKATVRVATRPFAMARGSESIGFTEGSLVILTGIQDEDKTEDILKILQQAAVDGIDVHSFNTQLSSNGPGLGTSHFKVLPEFKPLLIVGQGTRSYDAGEAWFQLDQNLGVAPVMTNLSRLKSIDLSDYSHLLMVDGRYSDIGNKEKRRIASWIESGGVLVAVQGAASWAESLCFDGNGCENNNGEENAKQEPVKDLAYGDFNDQRAQRTVGGAIVEALADPTHPIAWGYDRELSMFRRGSTLLKASENAFATPVRYAKDPLLSGYIGPQRLTEMDGQAAIIAERHGKGAVIRFANNPIFRGFWRGTEKLWFNALYFGPVIRSTELPK